MSLVSITYQFLSWNLVQFKSVEDAEIPLGYNFRPMVGPSFALNDAPLFPNIA